MLDKTGNLNVEDAHWFNNNNNNSYNKDFSNCSGVSSRESIPPLIEDTK